MDEEVKVSELAEASVINDEDLLMTIQQGTNKKASFDKIKARINQQIELAKYQGGTGIDPNTTTEPLILSSHSNVPKSGIYYYIKTVFYESISANANRSQIAIGYINNEVWQRYYYSGNWSSWKELPAIREGTWTPTLSTTEYVDPTVNYTVRVGSYKKMGNMVFVSFYLRGKITALNGTNNYCRIKDLPFTPKGTSAGENAISLGVAYNLVTVEGNHTLIVFNDGIRLQKDNGATSTALKLSGTNDFIFSGSGWYEIE